LMISIGSSKASPTTMPKPISGPIDEFFAP